MLMGIEWWSRRSRMALAICIVEHLTPRAETLIAGNNDRAALIAARDQLEEQVRAGGRSSDSLAEVLQPLLQSAFGVLPRD